MLVIEKYKNKIKWIFENQPTTGTAFVMINEELFNGKCENTKQIIFKLLEEYKDIKLTKFECEMLRQSLKRNFKYITRDKDDTVFVFIEKPQKDNDFWKDTNGEYAELFKDCFKFVKWADEEPCLIADILANCEVKEDE